MMDPMSAIRAQGLTKRYGDTLALDALDLEIPPGELFGYLGPNGADKTTTIRLLLGLHRPTAGRAEIFGIDAGTIPSPPTGASRTSPASRCCGRGSREPRRSSFWGACGEGRMRRTATTWSSGSSSSRTRRCARTHGDRRKVQLIAAFASRAELLLLDEPTGGLDPLMEMVFRETVREAEERGQTVFLSSHILGDVEAVCDRVGILRQGRLVDLGTLAELRHLGAQTVEVVFEGAAPTLPPLPGVRAASAGPNAVRFEVTGDVGPLVSALGDFTVKSLTSREPSLEEIFLHHYEGGDGAGGR